jgi:hypothetical protein
MFTSIKSAITRASTFNRLFTEWELKISNMDGGVFRLRREIRFRTPRSTINLVKEAVSVAGKRGLTARTPRREEGRVKNQQLSEGASENPQYSTLNVQFSNGFQFGDIPEN